jgi:hypothetical protein
MYIDQRSTLTRRQPAPSPAGLGALHCPCCGLHGLGEDTRLKVKEKDVPVEAATNATKGISRRVRAAVSRLSYSSVPILQNTARRIVDGDVKLRFIGDLQPVANPTAVLQAMGIANARIPSTLQIYNVLDIPGSDPVLIPKQGNPRAFERNRVVYIPSHSVEPKLSIDIVHETNHAMNPILADPTRDPDGFLFESFIGEVRAALVADYREVAGQSNKGNYSLALEMAIEDARQQAVIVGWTTSPDWEKVYKAAFTWVPDGNLDNRK